MFEDNEHAKENATEVPEGPSSSTGIRKRRRREDTTFQCPQCHRAFGRVEHLRRHANTHGEARSFKCLLCGKGFNRLCVFAPKRSSHFGRAAKCADSFCPVIRSNAMS